MRNMEQATMNHKRQWGPWHATSTASGAPKNASSVGESDNREAASKGSPVDDPTSDFFHESSQILTGLCGTLQVAMLVDSDEHELRRAIQQSVDQGRQLLRLFRSFRAEVRTLHYNATTDPLTGLKNRRTFDEHLSLEISRSLRHRKPFGLLLLDLRKFKLANDQYGHTVGDDILRAVARACVECMRSSDISFRIGGDEFAVLLPHAERPGAETLAKRVARKFEIYAKPLAPNLPLGVDYGIAVCPDDGAGPRELLQTADRNLYEEKQAASQLAPVATNRAFVLAV